MILIQQASHDTTMQQARSTNGLSLRFYNPPNRLSDILFIWVKMFRTEIISEIFFNGLIASDKLLLIKADIFLISYKSDAIRMFVNK